MLRTTRALAAAASLMLALGGCTGRDGDAPALAPLPPVVIPDLEPEPQPFRVGTALVDGVFSVDVPLPGGGTRTLDSVRHHE